MWSGLLRSSGPVKPITQGGQYVPNPSDDFATIRARMEELRHEREEAERTEQAKASEQTTVRVNRMGQVSMATRRLRNKAG